jgi:hypothetical protein
MFESSDSARRKEQTMTRAKDATLVLCLFVVYCVLLSQGLKANAVSAFFGALAAVPLTVHLYRRLWPSPLEKEAGKRTPRQPARRATAEGEKENTEYGL